MKPKSNEISRLFLAQAKLQKQLKDPIAHIFFVKSEMRFQASGKSCLSLPKKIRIAMITNTQLIIFDLSFPIDGILMCRFWEAYELLWIFRNNLAFEMALETIKEYNWFFNHGSLFDT
jgi:hypothetical protein